MAPANPSVSNAMSANRLFRQSNRLREAGEAVRLDPVHPADPTRPVEIILPQPRAPLQQCRRGRGFTASDGADDGGRGEGEWLRQH